MKKDKPSHEVDPSKVKMHPITDLTTDDVRYYLDSYEGAYFLLKNLSISDDQKKTKEDLKFEATLYGKVTLLEGLLKKLGQSKAIEEVQKNVFEIKE